MGTILPDNANRAAQMATEGEGIAYTLTKNVDSREVRTGAGGVSVTMEKDAYIGVPVSEAGVSRNERGADAVITGSVMHEELKQDVQAHWPRLSYPDEDLASLAVLFGEEPSFEERDFLEKTSEKDEHLYSAEVSDKLRELFDPKDPGELAL